jgi:hypothetical protein
MTQAVGHGGLGVGDASEAVDEWLQRWPGIVVEMKWWILTTAPTASIRMTSSRVSDR